MSSYQMINGKELRFFLKDFGVFIQKCLRFIRDALFENWWLVLLVFSIIMGGGYYFWKKQPAYYESVMVCSFHNLHKKTFGEMVRSLNKLAATHSYHQLAASLGITEDQASSILAFDAKNISGSSLHEDITPDKLPMYFTLRATEKSVFPVVETALLNYLNHTPYGKLRAKIEEEKIHSQVQYLNRSINKIDTVIDAYAAFLLKTKSVTDSAAGFSNIAALFSYQEQLHEKKINALKLLYMLNSVEMIYGFEPTDQPLRPGKGMLMKIFLFALIASTGTVVFKKLLAGGKKQ